MWTHVRAIQMTKCLGAAESLCCRTSANADELLIAPENLASFFSLIFCLFVCFRYFWDVYVSVCLLFPEADVCISFCFIVR